jgi:hypothetical protein
MESLLIKLCLFNLLFWIATFSHAQKKAWNDLDSATKAEFAENDSLSTSYYFTYADSTLYYGQICLNIALKNNVTAGIIRAYTLIGYAHWLMGNYPPSIEYFQKARQLCELHPQVDFRDFLLIQIYDGLGCVFCSSWNEGQRQIF